MRKYKNKLKVIGLGFLLSLGIASFSYGQSYVPVISKGFQHPFWLSVKDGSEAEAKNCNLTTTFVGPDSESNISSQINMFENALVKNPSGIILAPLDAKALIPVVNKAKRKHIPVITFDSGLDDEYPISFVATNNVEAGALAASKLISLLKKRNYFDKAVIGIVAHNAGTTSAIRRVQGFIDYMKANAPQAKILEVKYSDGVHDKARQITLDMLRAHPEINGLYATNDGAAIGMALGIGSSGKKDQLVKIGFDDSQWQRKLLAAGNLDGIVAQDPYQIGYQAMKLMCETLKGHKVQKVLNIPTKFITEKDLK